MKCNIWQQWYMMMQGECVCVLGNFSLMSKYSLRTQQFSYPRALKAEKQGSSAVTHIPQVAMNKPVTLTLTIYIYSLIRYYHTHKNILYTIIINQAFRQYL